ncbi:predicted protein [Nematostella vectensis]|uniref:Uncharacterized protein n=1 Tax=Nematostella vectensis TaxID=45351 RepID=A7S5T7_NEMVE|nr:predicted protein [Nematostella vectensis]|eukprot:XP_001633025.1 predicted protein [Nematostella vectensis]
MTLAQKTDVQIDGESFDLVRIPKATSKLVTQAKGTLMGSLDLASLVDDLGKLGSFVRLAYNGVAGNTEVQIKVQRVGYKVTKLADKSAVTVHRFKSASQSVLQELQGTYQYLLDGLEEMAVETLSLLADVASKMATAADELHTDFEAATEDVIEALEDTQRAKGGEEERKKKMEQERKEFEMRKRKAEVLQKSALEAEAKAEALYNEAQIREDKALDNQDKILKILSAIFTAGAAYCGNVGLALAAKTVGDAVTSTKDNKEALDQAKTEKMRHLDDLQKQRDIRREALQQCIEFTERIKHCDDDESLAEVAAEALHNSVGALKSLSAIMMNAATFWRQMQLHCETLAKQDIQRLIEKAITLPEEKRIKVWTSTSFKTKAVQYYSKWVALDDVCGVYMHQIRDTRKDLYNYLQENYTVPQARKNVKRLAVMFADDLMKAQKEIDKKEFEASKEILALEAPPKN